MKNMMERSKSKSNRRESAAGLDVTTELETRQKPKVPNGGQLATVNRETPSGTKPGLIKADKKRIRIAPGKLLQVQGRLLQGESQRQIARELRVSRRTVVKVIRTGDFQSVIQEQRGRLFSIVPAAVDSLRAGVATDPHLAFALLRNLGVVPDREAMLALANATSSMNREDQGGLRQAVMLAACMLESEKVYGTQLPEDVKARLKQMENGL
jgi:hypothetical protein